MKFLEIGAVFSEGMSALSGANATGGSSGGGSINIFIKKLLPNVSWSMSVVGGKYAESTPRYNVNARGGAGGNGSATIGTITNGTFSAFQ